MVIDVLKVRIGEAVGLPMELAGWADVPDTNIIEYTNEFLVFIRRVVYPSDYPIGMTQRATMSPFR